MKSFKFILLFSHALALLILFLLPQMWMIIPLSCIFLSFYLHQSLSPLQKIMESNGKYQEIPIEKKNSFLPLLLSLKEMSEKLQKLKSDTHVQDQNLSGILNALSEGVIAFNVRSKITFANQNACKMLKLTSGELIGRSLLYLGEQKPFLEKCHEVVLHALQTAEETSEKWNSDGLYFDLIASPLTHQEGAILVIQDKTADYKVVEVGKNFIANASHELKTPITIIRGFAEMLQNGDLPSNTKEEITNKIVHTCDRLDHLVKSLLTLSDLEHFSTDCFRACQLSLLLENCKHTIIAAHPEVKISTSPIPSNLQILGDFDLLDLALMNLLENAVKYSVKPANIHLKVSEKKDTVQITVEDQGIGIPEHDLPRIFDRFYTVDKARSRKNGGAGLGLSIVKLIAEKHGGEITASSRFGHGSSFSLDLIKIDGFS